MSKQKLGIIACGVLEWNLRHLTAECPDTVFVTRILPAQLHANPKRLRVMVQEHIDQLSAEPGIEGIILGFGVCGRGTVGLEARTVPLVIPKTQDCIGIFLGSHQRYLREFSRRPGTKYMTHGWYEKTVLDPGESQYTEREESLYGPDFGALCSAYGEENAHFICEFRESWKRNYQRSAYIQFAEEQGSEPPPGRTLTEATARSLNWEHEVLEGDPSLLQDLLSGNWANPNILVVPPGNRTVAAPGGAVIGFTAGITSDARSLLDRFATDHGAAAPKRSGLGLGIDTGGTYTDAVIFDFANDRVVAYAKAPTTHGNLVVGIRNVLSKLPAERLRLVERVGISTTLATNAFVEHKGRAVALMLMTPFHTPADSLPFRFVRKIAGTMSIDGQETEGIDPVEVAEVAKEALSAGCEAVAISGFGSVINPAHEQEVARIVLEASGLHAVCGHELSTRLNFVERATTAAMNARLVPLIESLLDAVDAALEAHGVSRDRVMVVKGDGSQMLARVARDLPVETILSGPAASVVGAARLFHRKDAVVADMGGTTLDVARIRKGLPILSTEGARIGEFQTSVRAMAARTIGLGGDSEIDPADWPRVRIGPRRIVPICRMTEEHPGIHELLDTLSSRIINVGPNCLELVALTPGTPPEGPLLAELKDGPLLMDDWAERLGRPAARHVRWQELETQGRIQRYGLTLTDVLHVQGLFNEFDSAAAEKLFSCWTMVHNVGTDQLADAIHAEFRRMVCEEVLSVLISKESPWFDAASLRTWMAAQLARMEGVDRDSGPRFHVDIGMPVIPVGAPTPALFPQLETVLGQKVLVSEYAGVANALGAIAGDVMLQEIAEIRVTEEGAFLCSWRGGTARMAGLEKALAACLDAVRELVEREAAANSVPFSEPCIRAQEHVAQTMEGDIFLGLTLVAELRG
jgi:N-methylhydantoinase A/oxoprolinase/acetone carboxylase beta subunit